MSISKRRKLGFRLVAISVVAMVAFISVGVLRGNWHYDGGGSFGNAQWSAYSGELNISGYYLIPIILCGGIGLFYLVSSLRKPPKLTR